MVKIEGLYNTAFCYTPVLEDAARAQIQSVCDQKEFAGCKIRVMPDVHAGKGCTIGTTMTIRDKIVPGMVGVDIGCGMETVELSEREIDFERLDALIRKEIPYGREVRDEIHALNAELDLSQLCCADQVNLNRAMRSIGSLGGGNHFIEVDRAEDGRLFLVVHSGSRHLGTEVANFYQDEGRRALWGGAHYQIKATIDQMKAEGRFKEIQKTITALKREHDLSIPKDLAYVEGALFDDYIHDMKLTQKFAVLNRKAMVDVILSGMGLTPVDEFTTIHNYIDTDAMILRKGSVSAKAGEKLLIPINMRDGIRTADDNTGMAKEIIDLSVNGKYEVWILGLNPYLPTVVLFHLIAQLFRWAHFMVAVNAEESDWNLRQIIFASVVSPIPIVVQSDVTQDNESAFGLDLLPLTERDDPLKLTMCITCQIDLVFRMQQLTHIGSYA